MPRPGRPKRPKPTPETERLGEKVTRGTRRYDVMLVPEVVEVLKAVADGHNRELWESGQPSKGRVANLSHIVRDALAQYVAAHRVAWIEKGWLRADGSPPPESERRINLAAEALRLDAERRKR